MDTIVAVLWRSRLLRVGRGGVDVVMIEGQMNQFRCMREQMENCIQALHGGRGIIHRRSILVRGGCGIIRGGGGGC